MLMRNMLRTNANRWQKTQERKMTDQTKKIKDIKEDEERLKRQEKKKPFISSLIFLIIILF